MRELALAWPPFSALFIAMVGASGLKPLSIRARHSILRLEVVARVSESYVEILLVEDNPHDVELTMHALRRHQLANRIHVARDGAEALDFLFCRGSYAGRSITDTPKVVLLDLKLPLIDGMEVLRQVKANPYTQAIPIVVLTSSREERDVVETYQLGVNSYIVKPVDFVQFTDSVRQIGLYWVLLNEPPQLS